ncbi:MAG: peptidylprolyl isomerase [Bacteroidales bacterium]|nr:peptidylprolyl isomerase [Candidatus Sodaliphilus aphodohippi]
MKNKLLISALILGTALLATAAKDPVLMKINGKEIKLSEFEYLYHKNSQQQIEKETLEQYVDRFVNYKLKVADAEAAKIDTLPAFQKELNGYRNDIVKPFLEDTTIRERLVQEAYERFTRNVNIDHIMLPLGHDFISNKQQKAFADSIRQCLIAGQNWDSIAMIYSIDQSKVHNGSHYGYITGGSFPYAFEYAAFNTPIGTISEPVKTAYGYHLIRVNAERQDEGTVRVQHILRLFPQHRSPLTASEKAEVKAKIDSIYALVKAGGDFEALAKEYSQDPGSAKKGGDLGFFSRGKMVPQFDKVSFELANGEISEPFETDYGYHIVKKLESKPTAPLSEIRKGIETAISRDERSKLPQEVKLQEAKQIYKYVVNPKLDDYINQELTKNGGYDSAFVAKMSTSTFPVFTYADQSVLMSSLAEGFNANSVMDNANTVEYIKDLAQKKADKDIMGYYTENLINDNADCRNLYNEYRDGMLLFEISNRKVWEGASRDTTGLNNYFEANRTKYAWNAPHFKGIILSAKSDSILNLVKQDIAKMGMTDTTTKALHKKYSNNIKMERMTVAQGENKAADYLMFNGAPLDASETYRFPIVLEGGIINNPESVADVRGQVTSDYQDVLEAKWLAELKQKYPVEINKKVLKKIK